MAASTKASIAPSLGLASPEIQFTNVKVLFNKIYQTVGDILIVNGK